VRCVCRFRDGSHLSLDFRQAHDAKVDIRVCVVNNAEWRSIVEGVMTDFDMHGVGVI
jgi:hypothetical protein